MNPCGGDCDADTVFWDSNTYCYDPRSYFGDRYPAEDRWSDLLAKQTGCEVINAGSNGKEIPRNPYALRLLNIPFADTCDWDIELTFDGVHFIEAGHHSFAERIQREIHL